MSRDPSVEADHRSTSIGRLAQTQAKARELMESPWSMFNEVDIRLYAEHLEAMDSAYHHWFGAHLMGKSPLQLTMYSGPHIERSQPVAAVGRRTWIEWSGGSLSCWNAAPSEYAVLGGAYDRRVVSRIVRTTSTPLGLLNHPAVVADEFWVELRNPHSPTTARRNAWD